MLEKPSVLHLPHILFSTLTWILLLPTVDTSGTATKSIFPTNHLYRRTRSVKLLTGGFMFVELCSWNNLLNYLWHHQNKICAWLVHALLADQEVNPKGVKFQRLLQRWVPTCNHVDSWNWQQAHLFLAFCINQAAWLAAVSRVYHLREKSFLRKVFLNQLQSFISSCFWSYFVLVMFSCSFTLSLCGYIYVCVCVCWIYDLCSYIMFSRVRLPN